MPKKHRGTHRLLAAFASGFLLMAASLWAGCDGAAPESKPLPLSPRKLTDIATRGSGELLIRTPTAVVATDVDPAGVRTGDTNGGDTTEPEPPPAAKKEPDRAEKRPTDSVSIPPKHGGLTIQIGAYIIDDNLSSVRERITSLGFAPYTTQIVRKMKMFCVIVGKGKTEAEGREISSALSGKGLAPRLLPNDGNTVDVAAGIYYYKYEALKAEDKIRSLGYTSGVEERTVEVVLTCLRTGDYATAEEAEKDLSTLKQHGLFPVIVKSDQ